jgi:hypothetical protein
MERAMSFLTTSRAPAFADQKGRFTKPLFGFAAAILVQLPDPQGHLSLGFAVEHLQLLLTPNITHSSERKNFMAQSKRA